ncbi:MAG: hypothetical protein ACI81R_003351 [Bradymonadia bacterium]|jgi:hypothetical protein
MTRITPYPRRVHGGWAWTRSSKSSALRMRSEFRVERSALAVERAVLRLSAALGAPNPHGPGCLSYAC